MKRWMMMTAIVLASVLLAGCTTSDPVMRDVDRCWVEIYEGEHFASQRSWTRIQGPSELRNLRELAGRDWNDAISSIRVGPGATVEVFEHADFRGQSEIFSPGRQVSTLRDFGLNNEISSIRTRCD
jgi:predicted small secreted protein